MENIIKLRSEIDAIKKDLMYQVKIVFIKESKELLETAPEDILGFRWVQYTPYFNDGDTCTFYANTEAELIDNHSREEGFSYEYYCPNTKEAKDLKQKLDKLLGEFNDDEYLDMFGDHCMVEILKDGTINIQEYDHE